MDAERRGAESFCGWWVLRRVCRLTDGEAGPASHPCALKPSATFGCFTSLDRTLKIQLPINTPVSLCPRCFYPGFYVCSSEIQSLQIKYHYRSFFPLHTSLHSPCASFSSPLPLFMLSFPLSHPYKARLLFFRTRSCN